MYVVFSMARYQLSHGLVCGPRVEDHCFRPKKLNKNTWSLFLPVFILSLCHSLWLKGLVCVFFCLVTHFSPLCRGVKVVPKSSAPHPSSAHLLSLQLLHHLFLYGKSVSPSSSFFTHVTCSPRHSEAPRAVAESAWSVLNAMWFSQLCLYRVVRPGKWWEECERETETLKVLGQRFFWFMFNLSLKCSNFLLQPNQSMISSLQSEIFKCSPAKEQI